MVGSLYARSKCQAIFNLLDDILLGCLTSVTHAPGEGENHPLPYTVVLKSADKVEHGNEFRGD